jgi:hypothetical protein
VDRLDERTAKQIPHTNCTRVPVIYNNKDARYERLMSGVSTASAPVQEQRNTLTTRVRKRNSVTVTWVFEDRPELRWPSRVRLNEILVVWKSMVTDTSALTLYKVKRQLNRIPLSLLLSGTAMYPYETTKVHKTPICETSLYTPI